MLFHVANLPYWILLGSGVGLFLLVIFAGGVDDQLELEADASALDAEAEAELDGMAILGWLGIGQAPLILLLATDLSLWGLIGWMLNVTIGELFGQPPAVLVSSGVAAVALVMALVLGRMMAQPLGQVFAAFGEDTSRDRLVGCTGIVTSAHIPVFAAQQVGQVDVIDRARNRVSILAILPEWATVVPQHGIEVVVIDRELQRYLVIVKDSPDQDYWLAHGTKHT